jgi:hypothetical protein
MAGRDNIKGNALLEVLRSVMVADLKEKTKISKPSG